MNSENSSLFIKENIDKSKLSEFSYSSRKDPEYMCYRLVKCSQCELVYSIKPPDESKLAKAYHSAAYNSSDEASDAALSYLNAVKPVLDKLTRRLSVLEIGTGNGIFLERLQDEGFTELVGIEPSSAAISSAPTHRLPWIRKGMFDEKEFPAESFDLICCFMTMEHVRDPDIVAQAAFRLLRAGGVFITVTHNYQSLVNRLLGKHSPIIDIEHLQLFSEDSMRFLLENTDYSEVEVKTFKNTYSLQYWIRLLPLPTLIKHGSIKLMAFLGLSNRKVALNVGNIISSGFKRE